MAPSCGAPGGCGFAYAIVHCGGAVHFGVRSLRGSWGAWLPLPWVRVAALDYSMFCFPVYVQAPLIYTVIVLTHMLFCIQNNGTTTSLASETLPDMQ